MRLSLGILILSTTLVFAVPARGDVIFSQDFSSAPNDYSAYVGTGPGQWDTINWSKTTVGGIKDGAMFFTHNGDGTGTGAGWFARATDFNPIPNALIYSFDVQVSGNRASTGAAATWEIGAGFSSSSSSVEPSASDHSRFGIQLSSIEGKFRVADLWGHTSPELTGLKTITWVINNSGADLNYLAPNNTEHTLSNDCWDLWTGGATPVFSGVDAQSVNQSLSDIKFVFHEGYGTIKMDNFNIRAVPAVPVVPEPSTTGLVAVLFLAAVVFGRWRTGG